MRVYLLCTLLAFWAAVPLFAQDTNFATGPQYLANYGSPMFARSLSTPTLSLGGPPLETGASNATGGLIAGAENRIVPQSQPDAPPAVNLFPIYYGEPQSSVIEISFAETPGEAALSALPASILDTGVWQTTTAEVLPGQGVGVTVGEAAVQNKARAGHANHVYTNTDIDRLHGG
jgi:hypothetical protein